MNITKLPDNFSPVFSELIYEVSGAGGDILDLEVLDESDSVLGVKRFAGTDPLKANVAGYLSRLIDPCPQRGGPIRFVLDPGRFVTASVRLGGVSSARRVFTAGTEKVSEYRVLSRLAGPRQISDGEYDEISLPFCGGILNATLEVIDDRAGGLFTIHAQEFDAPQGVVTLVVDAGQIYAEAMADGLAPKECSAAHVRIFAGDTQVAGVEYSLVPKAHGSVRLCWLNGLGGIDYRTFGRVERKTLLVEKESFVSEGAWETRSCEMTRAFEFAGECHPLQVMETLSEIVSSPRVWRVEEDGSLTGLEILTRSVPLYSGELEPLAISAREKEIAHSQKF